MFCQELDFGFISVYFFGFYNKTARLSLHTDINIKRNKIINCYLLT